MAYEPFDYPVGQNLVENSLNGGAGFGGAWRPRQNNMANYFNGSSPIVAGCLAHPTLPVDLPTSGNSVVFTGQFGSTQPTRSFSSYAKSQLAGASGTTTWLSFLPAKVRTILPARQLAVARPTWAPQSFRGPIWSGSSSALTTWLAMTTSTCRSTRIRSPNRRSPVRMHKSSLGTAIMPTSIIRTLALCGHSSATRLARPETLPIVVSACWPSMNSASARPMPTCMGRPLYLSRPRSRCCCLAGRPCRVWVAVAGRTMHYAD